MILEKRDFRQVLIVDDDPTCLYLVIMLLEEMDIKEGIVTFASAERCLNFIKKHCMNEHAAKKDCPDLILLDINMPGMDGFEFMDNLQILKRYSLIHTAVVILTSSDSPKDRERMQAYGVRGYLIKPISEVKVLEMMATIS
jgi:CheY-like chemotaxis protein